LIRLSGGGSRLDENDLQMVMQLQEKTVTAGGNPRRQDPVNIQILTIIPSTCGLLVLLFGRAKVNIAWNIDRNRQSAILRERRVQVRYHGSSDGASFAMTRGDLTPMRKTGVNWSSETVRNPFNMGPASKSGQCGRTEQKLIKICLNDLKRTRDAQRDASENLGEWKESRR
jgi:hypothetical protein